MAARIPVQLAHFSNIITVDNISGIQFIQGNKTSKINKLFIDQIELIKLSDSSKITQTPEIIESKGYERHIDIKWKPITDKDIKYIKIYRSNPDGTFRVVGIQSPWISGFSDFFGESMQTDFKHKITFIDSNYNEYPFSKVRSTVTQRLTDEAFLDMIQEANFRYYWDGEKPNSGLAFENIPGRTSMIATGASGFGIMAIISGVERGFVTRELAVKRFLKITRFLSNADRFHGVYPHFLDGSTGKTVPFFGNRDNGGDLVETSFLIQGLLTAHQYFNRNDPKETEIRNAITSIWKNVEWDWFKRNPDAEFLLWALVSRPRMGN